MAEELAAHCVVVGTFCVVGQFLWYVYVVLDITNLWLGRASKWGKREVTYNINQAHAQNLKSISSRSTNGEAMRYSCASIMAYKYNWDRLGCRAKGTLYYGVKRTEHRVPDGKLVVFFYRRSFAVAGEICCEDGRGGWEEGDEVAPPSI